MLQETVGKISKMLILSWDLGDLLTNDEEIYVKFELFVPK